MGSTHYPLRVILLGEPMNEIQIHSISLNQEGLNHESP
jgi:hypothetical protein